MYPHLVRGFFKNMSLPEVSVRMFKTFIDGMQIEVTPEWINQHLNISPTAPSPPPPAPPGHPELTPIVFRSPPTGEEPDIGEMVEEITEKKGIYIRGSQLDKVYWFLDHLLF